MLKQAPRSCDTVVAGTRCARRSPYTTHCVPSGVSNLNTSPTAKVGSPTYDTVPDTVHDDCSGRCAKRPSRTDKGSQLAEAC